MNLRKKSIQIACRCLLFNKSPSQKILKYIGCNPEEYRKYINQKRFDDMTDDNFGITWQLDHVVPVELFDLNKEEDLFLCFNYRNMLPMYSFENKAKGMSVHFSELLLSKMKKDDIVEKLIDKCKKEVAKYEKYLIKISDTDSK